MLYLPVIDAIEAQLQKHALLATTEIDYYRFALPKSSVRSKFICIPWSPSNDSTMHANPCIADDVSNSCTNNYRDQHLLKMSMLVGAAKHGVMEAAEVLDTLQDCAIEQIKDDPYVSDSIRFVKPDAVASDVFLDISKNHVGSIIHLDVKYIDSPAADNSGQISYLLDPTVEEG